MLRATAGPRVDASASLRVTTSPPRYGRFSAHGAVVQSAVSSTGNGGATSTLIVYDEEGFKLTVSVTPVSDPG
jgi:hypothetical protein